jgi:2-polyprenyl-6-methoxyphenol hydroxylase-like FAD-dependent oxidoreductase
MPTSPALPASPLGHRAVVLGASLAGLLAARVLSERYSEVVLLERDELPAGAAPRKGTPHAVHPHGLLARGREVLEELFPGFTQTLLDGGALLGDLQRDVAFDAGARRFAARPCGRQALAVSRLAIEAEVRRRVLARPGVRAVTGVDVLAPMHDAARARVTGVRWAVAGEPGTGTHLAADLVVDCTGRASRTPQWLGDWGYAPAQEDKVEIGICYTSAYFRREGAFAYGAGIEKAALICTVTPALPRPATMIAQEPEADGVPRWVVGVGGYAGDHAPATIEGLRERAAAIGSPELVRLTRDAVRIGEVIRYHYPHSLRRRYERLRRFPAAFLVLGDALTTFNPIYGQGMTVAACEALALRQALQGGLDGLHWRYFRAAARIVDVPWQLAAGGDLAIDAVPGPRPLPVRLVNAYVARLYTVAHCDPVVARAFLEVVHMVKTPATLFAPAILGRVWWQGRPGRAGAKAAAAPQRAVA